MQTKGKLPNGLTPQQELFALKLATGMTASDSYRFAYDLEEGQDKNVHSMAANLRKKPHIADRISEILRDQHVDDLDSPQKVLLDCLHACQEAKEDKNWGAVATLLKTRAQMQGMLKDRIIIHSDEHLSDHELARQLSQGDEHMEQKYLSFMGHKPMKVIEAEVEEAEPAKAAKADKS